MTVLLLIPARGGSKSVPRKNLADLGGRPLIEWVIAAATQSRLAATVAVSSDDDEILETAARAGVAQLIRRPDHLAGDEASSTDAALHALEQLAPAHDVVALVQPTSPFVAARISMPASHFASLRSRIRRSPLRARPRARSGPTSSTVRID